MKDKILNAICEMPEWVYNTIGFIYSCIAAALFLGVIFGVMCGITYIGAPIQITSKIWLGICSVLAFLFGIAFIDALINNHCFLTHPIPDLAFTVTAISAIVLYLM